MSRFATLLFVSGLLVGIPRAYAHCDGLDGPVVKAAAKALETGSVAHALIWVKKTDETEARAAFDRAMAVRKLGGDAQQLADRWFFETIVRLHRAGEGAPFDGLKPAGRDLGPAIPAADRALETGSAEAVVKLVTEGARRGIEQRFREALASRRFDPNDTGAGREYVHAYVDFVHYVEALYQAAAGGAGEPHAEK